MKKLSLSAVAGLALGITTIIAFAGPRAARSATELAKINGTVITLEEFEKKYRDNLKFFQFKAPSKKSVLDDLVQRELVLQEARKAGLDKNPEMIERMNTVLFQAYVDQRLSKEVEKINVTDEEAKSYYSKYPEIRTSHIFVAVRPDATAEEDKAAKTRITKILSDDLKAGASFAEVAQKSSEGASAPMGGDVDYKTREALETAYYDAALKLRTPGKISGVVKTPFGYHIIKLTAVRSWNDADKAQVKRQVFEERRVTIYQGLMKQLRQQASVAIKPELLKE